jgi:hypothetical protein
MRVIVFDAIVTPQLEDPRQCEMKSARSAI